MGTRYDYTFGGRERQELLARHVGSGKRVLDVGARDGVMTSTFSRGNAVTACDVDAGALRHGLLAKRLTKVVCADASRPLPFAAGTFEVVFCSEVLEHVVRPDRAVSEIARVLHTGGVFVGSVPNAFRLKNRIKFAVGQDFETEPTHLHHFSPGSLRQLLQGAFVSVELTAAIGRFTRLAPLLFGNVLVWTCRKA